MVKQHLAVAFVLLNSERSTTEVSRSVPRLRRAEGFIHTTDPCGDRTIRLTLFEGGKKLIESTGLHSHALLDDQWAGRRGPDLKI